MAADETQLSGGFQLSFISLTRLTVILWPPHRKHFYVVRKLMNSKFRKFTLTFCIPICMLTACSGKKIEITNEYIINENWTRENEQAWANSIMINRMRVKQDSSIYPFKGLSQSEVLSKLEEDSTFIYYTNVRLKEGESYNKKKFILIETTDLIGEKKIEIMRMKR